MYIKGSKHKLAALGIMTKLNDDHGPEPPLTSHLGRCAAAFKRRHSRQLHKLQAQQPPTQSEWEQQNRCCQTNANQSQFPAFVVNLYGTKLTPLSESGGAVELEIGT